LRFAQALLVAEHESTRRTEGGVQQAKDPAGAAAAYQLHPVPINGPVTVDETELAIRGD